MESAAKGSYFSVDGRRTGCQLLIAENAEFDAVRRRVAVHINPVFVPDSLIMAPCYFCQSYNPDGHEVAGIEFACLFSQRQKPMEGERMMVSRSAVYRKLCVLAVT